MRPIVALALVSILSGCGVDRPAAASSRPAASVPAPSTPAPRPDGGPGERLSDLERLTLKSAVLELQVARQQVQMLVAEHARAIERAKAAESRYNAALAELRKDRGLGERDGVDLETGAVVRAAAK